MAAHIIHKGGAKQQQNAMILPSIILGNKNNKYNK